MPLTDRGSRRSFLRGTVIGATGLIGSAIALRFGITRGDDREAAATASAADPLETPNMDSHGPITAAALPPLYLDGYKLHTAGRAAGAQRQKGDQTLLRGALLTDDGERVGEVFASALTMPGPVDLDGPLTPRLEVQNFQLRDGTLIGMGTAFAQADLPNRYTIVAGSGRYAGLRGTYTFENNPNVARADGRARLTFELDA